jgi:hypothetical protein
MVQVVGIDTLVPSSAAALGNAQSAHYMGQAPVFWGRYFYAPGQVNSAGRVDTHYSAAENAFLAANNISVLPIARQSGNVGGSQAKGAADAQNNVNAIFELFPPAYLAAACPDLFVFLDVEQGSPLASDYYLGWSGRLVQAGAAGQVRLHPAIYAGQADLTSWTALAQAVAAGAVCEGGWIARYHFGSPVPRAWDDAIVTPVAGSPCPLLAWQYWASADGAPAAENFDTSLVNPAHDGALAAWLVVPPGG